MTGVSTLTAETIILILRFAILLVLYLFLWQLVAVIWKDLHRPATGEVESARRLGFLRVVDGGPTSYEPGHAFPMSGTTTIGRGPENSIVLADGFVSTSHLVLELRDGEWLVEDLGSRNGTWVNGEKVAAAARIRYGDILAVGRVRLKLEK